MKELTKKQAAALEGIKTFIEQNGYSPTTRELAEALGYQSTSTVHALLEQLVAKGYISKEASGPRMIKLIKEGEPSIDELKAQITRLTADRELLVCQMQVIADVSTEERIAGTARQTLRDVGVIVEVQ